MEKKLYEIVGQRIQEARRRIRPRLRQEDIADRCDRRISRSSVANVERGHQRITLHQLFIIADVLGVEPATLLPAREAVFEGDGDLPRGFSEDPETKQWATRVVQKKGSKKP